LDRSSSARLSFRQLLIPIPRAALTCDATMNIAPTTDDPSVELAQPTAAEPLSAFAITDDRLIVSLSTFEST
jgi:hypothetical protein